VTCSSFFSALDGALLIVCLKNATYVKVLTVELLDGLDRGIVSEPILNSERILIGKGNIVFEC
jgi:hypothetical protein